MNRDDIIYMAREAGFLVPAKAWVMKFERFAALVAAAERESMTKDGWRRCAVGQRTTQFCGMLEDAVKAEREACAKVCDERIDAEYATGKVDHNEMGWTQACAIAIRARGDQK